MEATKEFEVMYVTKRDNSREDVSFDKVSNRLQKLIYMKETPLKIDHIKLAQRVCCDIYSGVKTSELDELAAQICAYKITEHADYGILASRLAISNHQKKTSPSFTEVVEELSKSKNARGDTVSIVTPEFYALAQKHKNKLNQVIDYERDYLIDYFGFKTLERAYLLKSNDKIVERPQHIFMRVALAIHGDDIKDVIECYHALSLKKCTHATPTLFNAGTRVGQLASCFLLGINQDSIHGIYDSLKNCALISKQSGGIGVHLHNVRGNGSIIGGGTGVSNGIVPMLRVFNNTARYVDQGGGKRNGSFAMYIEPWHADIFDFLEMKKNQGAEEHRARDLFYALWIPDLFMKRVETDSVWTLMCPNSCPGLSEVYGDDFEDLYIRYENEQKGKKSINARELWYKILESQIETGTPYMLYKDACNKKSNQKNLGTIKSSNLCCEIIEYSGETEQGPETAVCNLASISLPSFVRPPAGLVDAQVKIASKVGCSYCVLAETWCKKWNISYVSVYDEVHALYPQIYVNGDVVGGYDDFLKAYPASYDYDDLEKIAGLLTKNLNKIIDTSTYPIDEARNSNKRHRPIGLGVQGLADVFFEMRIAFDSHEARELNAHIFETIYYGSMQESLNIAVKRESYVNSAEHESQFVPEERRCSEYSGAYSSFQDSPLSQGLFQFDLWKENGHDLRYPLMKEHDWETLRSRIKKHGIRNSLLVAPMPTASTAQILGNTECFEPITSNIYVRRTLAGEFIILNKYLQNDLQNLGLWNEMIKNKILDAEGSIQHIGEIPKSVRLVYKTVWEISQKDIIELSADRAKFICQSQSLNLFQSNPSFESLTSMYFYAWKSGLKTGLYYLRTKPKSRAKAITVLPEGGKLREVQDNPQVQETPEVCEMCSA